jgi:cilia- and flagella-associated protein 57
MCKQQQIHKTIKFDYLFDGFHAGPITSMDVCIQKPIIATACKKDSTIRIWNYNYVHNDLGEKQSMQKMCQLIQAFKSEDDVEMVSELMCLALHPSGYYMAVGFMDKLQFFHILKDGLRPYKE